MTPKLGAALTAMLVCTAAHAQQADPLLLPKQCRDLLRSIPTRMQIAKNWRDNGMHAKEQLDTEGYCLDAKTVLGIMKAIRDDIEVCMAKTAADPRLTQADIDPMQQAYTQLSNGLDMVRRPGGDYDRLCRH